MKESPGRQHITGVLRPLGREGGGGRWVELKTWHLSPSEADVGEGGQTGGQVGDSPELESTGHLGPRPPSPLASLGTGRAGKVQLSSCTGSQQVQCLLWVGKGVTGLLTSGSSFHTSGTVWTPPGGDTQAESSPRGRRPQEWPEESLAASK